jgi:hypothetical protein
MNDAYYVYFWLREDGTPYYVGKGKGDRLRKKATREHRYPPNLEQMIILPYASEAEAFEAEMFFISFYGRQDLGTGCLRNRTAGGEGFRGTQSEVTKQKISNSLSGRPFVGKRFDNTDKVWSDVSRRRMSESAKRRQQREHGQGFIQL